MRLLTALIIYLGLTGAGAPAGPSLMLDGAAIGRHMVIVGERGRVLVSRDAGRSWIRAQAPTRATLTGVDFHDTRRGWAVGHAGTIVRSRDGGLSWETVYAAPEEQRPLLDVLFESAEHGFAVGAYGLMLETRDGGDSWQPRRIGDGDRHLNQISAASAGRLYVAAEAGAVFRSDDDGQHWQRLHPPYAGSFFGSLPLDRQRVYVYGLRGHLFYSADAGDSWRAVQTDTVSLLTNGLRVSAEHVLFTGMDGVVLTGNDAGGPVTLLQRPDRLGIAGALDAGDGALVVYGEFGVQRLGRSQLESAP